MWKHRHTVKTGSHVPWIILPKLKINIKKLKYERYFSYATDNQKDAKINMLAGQLRVTAKIAFSHPIFWRNTPTCLKCSFKAKSYQK